MMPAFVQMLEPCFLKTLEISLHASLIIGVLLVLRPLLKRMLPARWVYALWFVAIIRMVLVEVPSFSPPANPSLQTPLAFVQNINGENALTRLPVISAPNAPAIDWMEIVSVFWLIGAAGFLVYVGASHLRWSRWLAQAPAIDHPVVVELLAECCAEMDVRQVRLVQLPGFASPFITRLFHPTIVLPEDFLERFSREELRWILLHELAHLKRLDLPVQALCQLLQAIHWFNPFVWLGFACFRTDRELACDACVLDRQSAPNSHDYGHALIKVAETYPRTLLSPGFLGVSEERTDLQERVEKISRHRRPARIWIAAGAILCALLAFVFLTREAAPLHSATAKIQLTRATVAPEIEIMQSETVVGPAVIALGWDKAWAKRFGSGQDTLTSSEIMNHVSEMLTIKDMGTAIVYVTVRDADTKEAADLANAIVKEYKGQQDRHTKQEALDEGHAEYKESLARAESEVADLKQQYDKLLAASQVAEVQAPGAVGNQGSKPDPATLQNMQDLQKKKLIQAQAEFDRVKATMDDRIKDLTEERTAVRILAPAY